MKRILVSWIGGNDLEARSLNKQGPILATLSDLEIDEAHLLYSYPEDRVNTYIDWLGQQAATNLQATYYQLSSPTHFSEIYQAAEHCLESLSKDPSNQINILLSPGTPAMQAVWILLGKTKYNVKFYQASLEQGVKKVEIPFDIAAEYIPKAQLQHLNIAQVPEHAAFDDILTQNPMMQQLKSHATLLAQEDVPVLIQGETGTGKELFATAIHNASARCQQPFKTLNCGAIPAELIDSTLFGHVKGAFTGATHDRQGLFQAANGGTLFLDEFGELTPEAQVRLLRVLENGEVTPVGSPHATTVNVRIIAATNRDLIDLVSKGQFREDLFYRVTVGLLNLPPLRARQGDLTLLAEALLTSINQQRQHASPSTLTASAMQKILQHHWPGNVRELYSTLLRATLWAKDGDINGDAITQALFEQPQNKQAILNRPIGEAFDLQTVLDEVTVHYIERAMTDANGNKTEAANLLGISSYQTLGNWIKKYNIKAVQ